VVFDGQSSLLDILSESVTPFTPLSSVNSEDIEMYVGRGRYLWDEVSQQPVGSVSWNFNRVFNFDEPIGRDLITESWFEFCPLLNLADCDFLFDTLALSNVEVFNWSLSGHYLLWAGHEPSDGVSQFVGTNPNLRSGSIFFLTDLRTLTTQEILRYSSLGYQDRQVESFTWLPDSQTFAISLDRLDDAPFVPVPTLPSGGYPILHSQAGILLIHLDWLNES
jgi:hypothetical protein